MNFGCGYVFLKYFIRYYSHTQEKVNGDIDFQDVAFNYPTRPNVPVLKSLTFNIKTGQKIALVGSSGCGKSTSIGLLERFYNPKEGAIHIDGHEIRSFNLKWLRQQLGLVSQEPVLFARSIKDNITYGLERTVSEADIEKVARNANIHGFIASLPKVNYNRSTVDSLYLESLLLEHLFNSNHFWVPSSIFSL